MKRSTILWVLVLLAMVLVILPVPMAAQGLSMIANLDDTPLDLSVYEDAGLPAGAPTLVDWFEDFDSYPPGQNMHGIGGWKGWANDPAATAYTTDVEAHSAPNSVDIALASDLVHEYAGYDTGTWIYTAWQFVPDDFSGESYFILLNQYDDSGATNNWSTQVHFESTQDLVIADGAGAGQTLPLIRGEWVEIRVEIDLVSDWQQFYYGDQLLFEGSWTEGLSGGGILNIGAVDLFANGASSVYYDDLSLTEPVPEISVEPASLETLQAPDVVVTEPLTITNLGESPLDWLIYEDAGLPGGAPALVDWFEDFDSYPPGQNMHGIGGWKGWANDPAATAYTTDVEAHSAPNSVDIALASDLVHEYAGYDTGTWRYTAWQFVPNDYSGDSSFILLNQYDDSGTTNNWSTQVHFDSTQDLVIADFDGETLPLIRGQWVEIRVEIDLVNDWQEFYYDDQLLFEDSWTERVSGGGILNIGAVDLFANSASSVYYDDLSLVSTLYSVCDAIHDIPWVSVSPESGSTEAGESSPVDVAFDSIGLDLGVYTGTLCVSSNDPATPLVIVPLTMTVECFDVTTATISGPDEVLPGEVATYTVTWEPPDATPPIDILWSNGMTTTEAAYSWPDPGDYTVVVTVTNCEGAAVVTDTLDVTVPGPANLQVAHLAPFAMDPGTAVTVTLNGTPVLTDFAYGDSTEYLPVPAGEYLVEIFPAGSATPAISGTVNLMSEAHYTAIATGDGVNQPLALMALVDDNTPPAAGSFKLRVGHLAPFAAGDALADVRLQDGTPVLENVAYGDVAAYLELPAGEYDLKITTPGGDVTLIDPEPVTFTDGQILSAFATGEGANQPLGAYALPAGEMGFFLPLEEIEEFYYYYLPLLSKNY
jgi:hypothetical protein